MVGEEERRRRGRRHRLDQLGGRGCWDGFRERFLRGQGTDGGHVKVLAGRGHVFQGRGDKQDKVERTSTSLCEHLPRHEYCRGSFRRPCVDNSHGVMHACGQQNSGFPAECVGDVCYIRWQLKQV